LIPISSLSLLNSSTRLRTKARYILHQRILNCSESVLYSPWSKFINKIRENFNKRSVD
jgi:hypothetical protein